MFFNQDILVTETEGKWVMFLITPKGRQFVTERLRRPWADLKIKRLPGEVEAIYIDEKRGRLAYQYIQKNDILDIFFVDQEWMDVTYEIVEMHARSMTDKIRSRETGKVACDYFLPRIETAIAARDKREISKLISQMPEAMHIEKVTIINRLQFVEFPELRNEGVNLQNWYENTGN